MRLPEAIVMWQVERTQKWHTLQFNETLARVRYEELTKKMREFGLIKAVSLFLVNIDPNRPLGLRTVYSLVKSEEK